eukprot:6353834-Prymnesium_polylepis.1
MDDSAPAATMTATAPGGGSGGGGAAAAPVSAAACGCGGGIVAGGAAGRRICRLLMKQHVQTQKAAPLATACAMIKSLSPPHACSP